LSGCQVHSAARRFAAVLTFTGVVLLLQHDNAESDLPVFGVVTAVTPDTITVRNDQTDPNGLVFSLREDLRAAGAYPAGIETGSEIAVWYRRGSDRRPFARKIILAGERR
jgi:hypothetical protein